MQDLVDRLRTRFPLLAHACLHRRDTTDIVEALPPFLGLFMAAMATPVASPLCFVLPRRGDVARLAAVVYGLQRFVATQDERIRQYGETSFTPGELVRVHPSRHIFRFLGFDPRNHDFVCLRSPNGNETERWSVRAAEFIPRFERTTLTRPIGKLSTKLHDPEPSPLDQLLGTSTFGNQGLFLNEVVLLDSSAGFQRLVESTSLLPIGSAADFPPLKKMVPFGDLSVPRGTVQDAWFLKWDQKHPTGEPLIAVASSVETVAAYCVGAAPRSKLVVVNGLSRIRDLQSYDDIQQTQRLVLFADEEDDELIQTLNDRGCSFWELSRDEIEAGHEQAPRFQDIFGRLRIWARNRDSLVLDDEACENFMLDEACLRLEGLRKLVEDDDGPATKLVARMWRLLNEAAARVKFLSAEERAHQLERLQELRRDLQANRAWVPQDAESALAAAASALEALLTSEADPGALKGAALERIVAQCVDEKGTSLVLARSQRQALDIEEQFRSQIDAGRIQVCTPRGLKGERAFDRIVCPSWPTVETLESLTSRLLAPRITVLGYTFERRWLHQFEERRRNRPRRNQICLAQKSAIVGDFASDESSRDAEPVSDVRSAPVADSGIWTFERRLRDVRKGTASRPTGATETLSARYVSFVGATYAFLTETHKVVVVTSLVSEIGRTNQRLPEQTVGSLRPGDFIVFPESGDRELIQEQADRLLGNEAPTLRETAKLWKEALRSSGLTPGEFLREARELRRPRHIMTIRNWFADTSQIGPGAGNEDLSEDLELIALVTDFAPLKERMPRVIEAIKRLRSAHLSAGVRLRDVLIRRLPEAIGSLDEDGSMVNLGELGSAWIVQVESVAVAPEPRGRGEINRLFWESHGAHFDVAF
jgi:hypothetical protein